MTIPSHRVVAWTAEQAILARKTEQMVVSRTAVGVVDAESRLRIRVAWRIASRSSNVVAGLAKDGVGARFSVNVVVAVLSKEKIILRST